MRVSRSSRLSKRASTRCSSRLRLELQGVLLGCRYGPRDDEGDSRGDAAEYRDSGDHDCAGGEATDDGDGHVISVADCGEGGEGPPQSVAPRPDGASWRSCRSASHAAVPPSRTTATAAAVTTECRPDDGCSGCFASTRLHCSPARLVGAELHEFSWMWLLWSDLSGRHGRCAGLGPRWGAPVTQRSHTLRWVALHRPEVTLSAVRAASGSKTAWPSAASPCSPRHGRP